MSAGVNWRPAVVAIADLMEARLAEHDERHGGETWRNDDPLDLAERIVDNTEELVAKLRAWMTPGLFDGKPDNVAIMRQAADVANFAMMVADRCGPLPGPTAVEPDADFDIVPMPDRPGMHMFVALPTYARNNESIFLRLLLTSADVDEATVAGWTAEEALAADLWACAVHLNASDNDDIFVPDRPAHVPLLPIGGRPRPTMVSPTAGELQI